MANHVALLGDSSLDNGAYTGGGPDVITQLRGMLPATWRATLLAVDGAVIADLPAQLSRLPQDASHLVVSIGANDVLANFSVLQSRVWSTSEALLGLGARVAPFEDAYRRAIRLVTALRRSTAVCTVYNGNLDPSEAPVARIGLTAFNDVILRVGFEYGLAAIDLRLVCSDPADYANPIEPCSAGGAKIAMAIARFLGIFRDAQQESRVFR